MKIYILLTIAGYWWYKYTTICVFTIDYKLSRSFILYIYFVIVQEISFIVVDVRVPIWTREEARLPRYEWRLSGRKIQSKKRRKISWSYRLKGESNHVTWKYQFTTRVELTPMISSNMEVYHYNNKLVHTCTRLRNRWHLQPPREYQWWDVCQTKAQGTGRIDGWITPMKWKGKMVRGDKITRTNKEWSDRVVRRFQNDWQKRLNGFWLSGRGRSMAFHQSRCSRWRAKEQRRVSHCEKLRGTVVFPRGGARGIPDLPSPFIRLL